MQIVSLGDNLHEVSDPVVWEFSGENKKNIISLSSAEIPHSTVIYALPFVKSKEVQLNLGCLAMKF